MNLSCILIIILGLIFSTEASRDRNKKPFKVVCYFASWTNFFTAEDIDPNVCTHINYAFASLEDNKIVAWNPKNLIARLISLREKNPQLTFLVSIGGWADGTDKYSEMARSKANRKTFIRSVLEFMKRHDFDGLDFDWEFPTFKGKDRKPGRLEDRNDLTRLLKELKQAFRPDGYLLTAALTHSKYYIDRGYDVARISRYLDFINLMTYDYHGSWSRQTGHNSPLYPDRRASAEEQLENIQFTVDYFMKRGADSKKLILGIPLYSIKFQLAKEAERKVGSPVKKFHEGDVYSKICQTVKKNNGWHGYWDKRALVPYAVKGDEWISFEVIKSVEAKLDFANKRKLGGVMVWEVNGDDFRGQCGKGRFPMMKFMMRWLNG